MARSRRGYSVLVTGASGLVGQHMVGLLQTQADHVTEIRVLDIVPYTNKTDYESTKPVKQFTGSILDPVLVEEACTGVSCVIHLASLIDVSLFPDEQKLYQVNVEGTRTIIEACKKTGVKRLLYCSSAGIVYGYENIYDGREDNTPPAREFLFPEYGKTKQKAEELVLAANSSSLQTVSLRPTTIYGDYDWKNLGPLYGNRFTKSTGYYINTIIMFKMGDFVYAGNVAWAFIQADNTLRTDSTNQVAGQVFFINDDTPKQEGFTHFISALEASNLKPFPLSPPEWLVLFFLYLLFPVLKLVGFVFKTNCPLGKWAFHISSITALLSDKKARRILGYKPLFDQAQIQSRMVTFIKSL